ncbi:Nitrilase/cyanide hydratase and apolipo protein N-acyltransferase [Cutaneotrichosporon oleaginosum]|uniref:Nitrilase/cyanide hydratase and apolipo protein N-acyltransferase n=1 Tax=Cutaneotrichosporon oleaginosum TaxID=879819 RepID=A0A0J0XKT1_9TREE|nr:Nitrilase/cyanide hydratase and apolipo protein N-acyltransferase [Cutaneotrichosporon oleaginosum]KLT41706.1 Nitrilase/cyanide hydratase and apolipo protein N-acyltransferase [Cutaneotrichosporon oleaginosum]
MTRVAAVQATPVTYDLHKSLHKLRSLAFAARENGAELVVFPEAFLSAYPRHLNFSVGSRSPEAREWFGRYVRSSVKVPHGAEGRDWLSSSTEQPPGAEYYAFQQLAQIARKYTLYLSVGVVECANVGSTLWCTNLLFGPTGILLSKHRKIQPTAAERVVWAQGEARNPAGAKRDADGEPKEDTDNLPVVETAVGRIGALICWENYMPLARYLMYKKGVEVYLAPTADGRPTWLPTMQHIAMEGRCFVVTANQYHAASDFPHDYPPLRDEGRGDAKLPEIWSRGGSAIVGPLGDVLAGPLWDKEGILYADVSGALGALIQIDTNQLDGAKLDFDPIGHYAREGLLLGLLNDAGQQ